MRLAYCVPAFVRWQSSLSGLPGSAAADGPNEILRTLLTAGVPVADGEIVKLPEPTLADGMTAAAQRQQIEAIAEGRNSWEDLTRRSVVAPFILRTSQDGSEQERTGTPRRLVVRCLRKPGHLGQR